MFTTIYQVQWKFITQMSSIIHQLLALCTHPVILFFLGKCYLCYVHHSSLCWSSFWNRTCFQQFTKYSESLQPSHASSHFAHIHVSSSFSSCPSTMFTHIWWYHSGQWSHFTEVPLKVCGSSTMSAKQSPQRQTLGMPSWAVNRPHSGRPWECLAGPSTDLTAVGLGNA